MEKEIVKKYSNDELTVVWKPKLCIHAAECVKALPQVYNPNEKPWIKAKNATTQELQAQIKKCPSGALSYTMNEQKQNQEVETINTKVEVLEKGPLFVHGNLLVIDKVGNKVSKSNTTAFCRCGHSNNKPYCDGTHQKVNFQD